MKSWTEAQARHQQAVARADHAVREARKDAPYDHHIPMFHATAGIHWMNDPNGWMYCNEAYHLFYQVNPYHVEWGNIHWGHLRSTDLVTWEHLPIALAPSEPYDRDGCFSGSAIERAGQIELFYTSNLFITPEGLPDGLLQQQCVAVSDDGITFHKIETNPVIPAPPEEVGQTNHFRDPKVWFENGMYYMVLGTKRNNLGKVVLYRSEDCRQWEYVSTLTQSDGTMGYMYECPDLFPLQEEHVLVFCPEGALLEQGPRTAGYVIGQLSLPAGEYVHGPFLKLDHGFDFYAPQTLIDGRGRRILIGWMPMNGKALGKTWAGCMTIPRVLTSRGDGVLRQHPVEELTALREREFIVRDYVVEADTAMLLTAKSGQSFELIVTLDLVQTDAERVELHLCADEEGSQKTVIRFDRSRNEIIFDRTFSGASAFADGAQVVEDVENVSIEALFYDAQTGENERMKLEIDVPHWERVRTYKLREKQATTLRWHVFFDRSAMELFIQDGEAVMSGLIFPAASSQLCRWISIGGKTVIREMRYYAIKQRQQWFHHQFE